MILLHLIFADIDKFTAEEIYQSNINSMRMNKGGGYVILPLPWRFSIVYAMRKLLSRSLRGWGEGSWSEIRFMQFPNVYLPHIQGLFTELKNIFVLKLWHRKDDRVSQTYSEFYRN